LSKFYYDWDQQLSDPVWVTIGNFDGVHLGHQSLIQKLIAQAKSEQVKSMAVTFWPHPREFFSKEFVGFYLNNSQEKNFLLEKTGLDSILSLNFDSELANLDAAQFLTKLSKVAPLRGLMVGEKFAMGKERQGTETVIKRACESMSIPCVYIKPLEIDGKVVSSQRIRKTLMQGDMDLVFKLLGRTYSLSGRVAHGKKTGSKLGFPTANLYFDENRQLPKFGIYASKVVVNGKVYQGVTNVGIRPSFDDGNSPSVETLLLDFDDNIYNKLIHVNFIHFLREEKKFDRISDLIEQIKKDKKEARRILTHGI
jgi:riboflavin kinase/FMN adenylyltransferase